MFCSKCGANLPEGAMCCPYCGEQLQVQEETVQQSPEMHLSAKARGLKKKEFLANEASDSVKTAARNSLIFLLISVMLVFASVVVANNTAFYKLPLVSFFLTSGEEDAIEEIEEELEKDSKLFDEAREALEELEEELERKEYKAIEKFLDQMEDVVLNPSLSNLSAAVQEAKDITELELDRDMEKKLDFGTLESLEEMTLTFNIIKIVGYVFAIVVALFALLAFMKKSIGVLVFDAIIAAPFIISFAGLAWYCAILATFFVMMSFFKKINKAYKA